MAREKLVNAAGKPWSSWHKLDQFDYVMRETYPDYYLRMARDHEYREYAFDRAWPTLSIAVEYDGHGPGHAGAKGRATDYIKRNYAAVDGWRVFQFTRAVLSAKADVHYWVGQVALAIESGGSNGSG